MYNREKRGKFHIMLCATTPCMVCPRPRSLCNVRLHVAPLFVQVCGAYDIMHTIEAHLGIKVPTKLRVVAGLCARR